MDLRHVEYFLAVSSELHFRRAAERMMVSQTAITYHVHKLEQEIGVQLLDRNKRRVTLTAAGDAFARGSRRALAEAESATREARRIGRGDGGRVNVAANASLFTRVVPRVICSLRREKAMLELAWQPLAPADAIDAVRQRRVDVALTTTHGLVLGEELRAESFLQQPLMLAVPRGSRLRSLKPITLSVLGHADTICISDATGGVSAEYVRRLCRTFGVVPNIRYAADGMHAVLAGVAANQGVALVPALARDLHRIGIVYLTIDDLREKVSFEMVWHQDAHAASWLQAFRRGAAHATLNRQRP